MPAPRAALGHQLLLQVLVLALQPLDLALQAAVLTVDALAARRVVAQPSDLPVLLLDDNVPRVLFGRSFVQNRAYAAQQARASFLYPGRTRTFTPHVDLFRVSLNTCG